MKTKHSNPVIQEVIERFQTVEQMTKLFASTNTALNGLIVTGNAGMGKTRSVQQALYDANCCKENIEYVKGSSISAVALFALLWQNREKGKIIILDDVDLVHKTKSEVSAILDMFKGATEPTKGERIIGWMRGAAAPLFRDLGVPSQFDFQGSIIWITNDTQEALEKACGSHWNAISSRFRQVPVWLNEQEKVMYTLYLIEEMDILGKDCNAFEGGYSKEVIADTIQYIRDNWKSMNDVTPRVAISIADIRNSCPDDWKMYVEYQ